MAGLTRPDRGTVSLAGHVPWRDRRQVTRPLGVQLQSSGLQAKLTAREAVAMVAAFHDAPADPDELIERLGLGQVAGTRYAKLSGGQQQRLAIATALAGRPRVVLLDELTTGLYPEARREIWQGGPGRPGERHLDDGVLLDVRDDGVGSPAVGGSSVGSRPWCCSWSRRGGRSPERPRRLGTRGQLLLTRPGMLPTPWGAW